MTYKELLNELSHLTEEQLNTDVTVYVGEADEYYPLVSDYPFVFSESVIGDVLDNGHPYMVI